MFGRTPYEILEEMAHAELDDAFAELWTHIKCRSRPNYPSEVDPTKPSYMLYAKLTWEPHGVKIGLEESSISSRDPSIVIRSGLLQYPVDRGDRFQRCSTGDVFEVTNANPDSASGIIINLVQLGLQE